MSAISKKSPSLQHNEPELLPRSFQGKVMVGGKLVAYLATTGFLAFGFPAPFSIGAYALLCITHYADYQFAKAHRVEWLIASLQDSSHALKKTAEDLQSKIVLLSKETTQFKKSNLQLKKRSQDLMQLVQDVRGQTVKLQKLRESNVKLFEANKQLSSDLERTAKKIESLRQQISEEVRKLQGASTSIDDEIASLKKVRTQLGHDVDKIVKCTLVESKKASVKAKKRTVKSIKFSKGNT